MKKVLVTGSAGFIGFHLTKALLASGYDVLGIDNINDYYDPKLKNDRLKALDKFVVENNLTGCYEFIKLDISNRVALSNLFDNHRFSIVINLAAQAGVRYSLENPEAYVDSNLVGFANLLECSRHARLEHFLFASSSSVYGMNIKQPFSSADNTDYPISLYAATKKSNELLAYSYSHLFGIPCTGMRFFTVYGPYGRPDMAYYKFAEAISAGEAIEVFNNGQMKRDFTYIDDVVEAISRIVKTIPSAQSNDITNAVARFQILNIGNNKPVMLQRFIAAIEASLGVEAIKEMMPMQAGDVPLTYADIQPLYDACGFSPKTSIEEGIGEFISWYKQYKKQ